MAVLTPTDTPGVYTIDGDFPKHYCCTFCQRVDDETEISDGWLWSSIFICPLCALNEGLVDRVDQPFIALCPTVRDMAVNGMSHQDKYGTAGPHPQSEFSRWRFKWFEQADR